MLRKVHDDNKKEPTRTIRNRQTPWTASL